MVALGEHVDAIQEAEYLGALEEAGKRAIELAGEAIALGLPSLAEVARRVADTSRLGLPERLHEDVLDLTDVATRVRRGHRGGAGP